MSTLLSKIQTSNARGDFQIKKTTETFRFLNIHAQCLKFLNYGIYKLGGKFTRFLLVSQDHPYDIFLIPRDLNRHCVEFHEF